MCPTHIGIIKMKKLKLFATLFAFILSVCLVSCNDDKDKDEISSGITGSWKGTFSSGYFVWIFNSDGTGLYFEEDYDSDIFRYTEHFSYVYDNKSNTLITIDNEDGYAENYEITIEGNNVIYIDGYRLTRQ